MMDLTHTDDAERRLGRALVLLCEWGRQAQAREKTRAAGDDAPHSDDTDQQKRTS